MRALHCQILKCMNSRLVALLVALAEELGHIEEIVVNHFGAKHCLKKNSTLLCVVYKAPSAPTDSSAGCMAVQ